VISLLVGQFDCVLVPVLSPCTKMRQSGCIENCHAAFCFASDAENACRVSRTEAKPDCPWLADIGRILVVFMAMASVDAGMAGIGTRIACL
jgi:hypothetical protein